MDIDDFLMRGCLENYYIPTKNNENIKIYNNKEKIYNNLLGVFIIEKDGKYYDIQNHLEYPYDIFPNTNNREYGIILKYGGYSLHVVKGNIKIYTDRETYFNTLIHDDKNISIIHKNKNILMFLCFIKTSYIQYYNVSKNIVKHVIVILVLEF